MRIPEMQNEIPMPPVKPSRNPFEKPQDPIVKKSKHPTKVGNLGYLNSVYCPRCGRLLFSYYDKDRAPEKKTILCFIYGTILTFALGADYGLILTNGKSRMIHQKI